MTAAERQHRWRNTNSIRNMTFRLDKAGAKALHYLKAEWSIESNKEAVIMALRYMAQHTHRGLDKVELTDY